jgi:hypothetical protein
MCDTLFNVKSPNISEKTIYNDARKNVKVKAKFTLEQAMKAQMRSRGIALLFL